MSVMVLETNRESEPAIEIDDERLPVIRALAALPIRSWLYTLLHLRSVDLLSEMVPEPDRSALRKIARAASDSVEFAQSQLGKQTHTEER